jgi:hypothetical protein
MHPARPGSSASGAAPSSRWAFREHGVAELTTLTRLCIVVAVCAAMWLFDVLLPSYVVDPRPSVQPSTLLWFAAFAAALGVFRMLRGPEVQGTARLVWDGTILAFATAITIAAFMTSLSTW